VEMSIYNQIIPFIFSHNSRHYFIKITNIKITIKFASPFAIINITG